MKRLLRSLRKSIRYMFNVRTVRLGGVTIDTTVGHIPENVRELIFREIYEDTERDLIAKILKPGMRTLEIGTGIGFVSLVAQRICGEGNVYCYEANPELEPTIKRNFALNGMTPNLTMKAVTVDGAPITFFKSDNIISSSLYDRKRDDKQIVVEAEALADVLEKHDPQTLIMDVEGAEIELLAVDLKNIAHIIVELHPHIVGEEAISALVSSLAARGYKMLSSNRKTSHFARAA
ncbi:FkbM family methyltransferase [Pararhizobium sp. O133]|uniref:FkbM family methyltransferase n=1 Tax=Pararhizobium sp. O133 TaxID=3449278 RepID=UPI003F68623E